MKTILVLALLVLSVTAHAEQRNLSCTITQNSKAAPRTEIVQIMSNDMSATLKTVSPPVTISVAPGTDNIIISTYLTGREGVAARGSVLNGSSAYLAVINAQGAETDIECTAR